MTTYILDASAILRFFDQEAGVVRLSEIFKDVALGRAAAAVSAINYGEVIGIAYKRGGSRRFNQVIAEINELKIQIIPVDADRSARSAIIHADLRIPYADCFAIELASTPDHVLLTADFDFKPAAQDIAIEFLPAKSKP